MTFSGTMEMTEHVLGAKTAGRLTTLAVKEGDQGHERSRATGDFLTVLNRIRKTTRALESFFKMAAPISSPWNMPN